MYSVRFRSETLRTKIYFLCVKIKLKIWEKKCFIDNFENDMNFNIAMEIVYSKAERFTFHPALSSTIQLSKTLCQSL